MPVASKLLQASTLHTHTLTNPHHHHQRITPVSSPNTQQSQQNRQPPRRSPPRRRPEPAPWPLRTSRTCLGGRPWPRCSAAPRGIFRCVAFVLVCDGGCVCLCDGGVCGCVVGYTWSIDVHTPHAPISSPSPIPPTNLNPSTGGLHLLVQGPQHQRASRPHPVPAGSGQRGDLQGLDDPDPLIPIVVLCHLGDGDGDVGMVGVGGESWVQGKMCTGMYGRRGVLRPK